MHGVISDSQYQLPQLAPDGNYCPEDSILGDVNEDNLVNILDVITAINMIFGTVEINENADINTDGIIDVLDIMGIINIILGINTEE